MRQPSLFDQIAPCDPNVATEDVPRLSAQCETILARLRIGTATNYELAAIALKYTSRVSDLRKAGHDIRCERLGGGVTRYELF